MLKVYIVLRYIVNGYMLGAIINSMISTVRPTDFAPIYDVVSCFLEREDGKILLLLRLPGKSEGNKWGVVAGKIDDSERPVEAIIREISEETGVMALGIPEHFETYFIRYPDYDYTYHVFHYLVGNNTKIKISPSESQDFVWAHPSEALNLNLVRHQDDCIKFFYFPDM